MDTQPYAGVIHDLYQDVSGDEDARKQAKAVPELAQAFEALGLRRTASSLGAAQTFPSFLVSPALLGFAGRMS